MYVQKGKNMNIHRDYHATLFRGQRLSALPVRATQVVHQYFSPILVEEKVTMFTVANVITKG